MFVAGWRHALRSEWPYIIIIIISELFNTIFAANFVPSHFLE